MSDSCTTSSTFSTSGHHTVGTSAVSGGGSAVTAIVPNTNTMNGTSNYQQHNMFSTSVAPAATSSPQQLYSTVPSGAASLLSTSALNTSVGAGASGTSLQSSMQGGCAYNPHAGVLVQQHQQGSNGQHHLQHQHPQQFLNVHHQHVAGLPDPASVQKQKETYMKLLDSQLAQGVQALDVQLKQQRDAINSQADQQKKAFNMQVDMEVKAQEMHLQQQYQEQQLQLQQQAQQQKSQLEQQAMQLTMDFQQKKAEEEMQRQQYEMERQQQELQMKLQNEFHSMQAQLTSSLPAAFQFHQGVAESAFKPNGQPFFPQHQAGLHALMSDVHGKDLNMTASTAHSVRTDTEIYVYGPNGELIPKSKLSAPSGGQ
ncbi:unnamed protein product [Amoebophrya sp. A120]|nr:unnamed protein product [Amoebophrya sp. A120]|eukprot:GSA120T00005389001.1